MKIALITDLHFGCRLDSIPFLENLKKFFDTIFFPYIDKHHIDIIICLGDVLERRKYGNYLTLDYLQKCLFEPIKERNRTRNLRFDWILGNHDIYYREAMDVSAAHVLRTPGYIHSEATTFSYAEKIGNKFPYEYETFKVCFIPWICKQNKEQILKHI